MHKLMPEMRNVIVKFYDRYNPCDEIKMTYIDNICHR